MTKCPRRREQADR
ncbi:hypothetical protein YPPY02_1207, partial [Yersinia pestis PY-02]